MDNDEYLEFLRITLIKVENTINLLKQDVPKHIPAYHKMLGVQAKINTLNKQYKDNLFSQIITIRSIIHYLMNGRYKDAYNQIIKLKIEFVQIYLDIQKNERNKDK